MTIDTFITLSISTVAMIVSIIALVYTAKTYLLKSGAHIRGSYGICSSSVMSEEQYITSLTLENLKDRAVVIFKVYLRLGHNYFVEVENFEDSPLILRPFEAYKKEYGPIDFYGMNMDRIDINDLFSNKRIKKNIILSTSDGKYVVSSRIEHWDPVIDFFKNHFTAVIHPMRSIYKGKSYGLNAKYIVEFKMENGREEVVAIYPRDYEIKKFRNFRLTKESLDSKEALEEYLYNQIGVGLLNCEDILVHEMEIWRNEVYELKNKKVIQARYYNWFTYNIAGPVITKMSDYRLKRKNKAIKKQRANNPTQPTRKTHG